MTKESLRLIIFINVLINFVVIQFAAKTHSNFSIALCFISTITLTVLVIYYEKNKR